jgi:hypothetical protein
MIEEEIMNQTRQYFTHDELILKIRESFQQSLERYKVHEVNRSRFSNIDCLLSGLALFTFKFPSLLKFDQIRGQKNTFTTNLKNLFSLKDVPCDTYMRERLDLITPQVCRKAFSNIFTRLQRNKVLDHFRFFKDQYLISIDGTGIFSSHDIHCDHCCVKNHRNGTTTYHHQILAAALVHPDQKVVYPLAPEPIMNSDGNKKNDCERNALKRWVGDFRREHPHLKAIILADGLSSNEPFIRILKENRLSFILVCKETDHDYLTQWVKAGDHLEKPRFEETRKGIKYVYEYMNNVPLNDNKRECLINVVRFSETKKGKTTQWMWVTDLTVNLNNIREFVKGARARWKIENETFNTLKNQGYEFEHNFGHGKQYLHTTFAYLMLLAFLVDQCLQHVNKRFQEAVKKLGSKKSLWQHMLSCLYLFEIPNFESLYHFLVHPPPILIQSVI